MYRIITTTYASLISCLLIAASAGAQENQSINITTTAVPFLRISPDARSGAMGDAGIAVSPDANSIYHNQAKTIFITAKTGIAATYSPWMKDAADDMYLVALAGFYRFSNDQAVSASIRYFSLGNVPLIDYEGNRLMSFKPAEYTVELGYARKLSSKLGIGLTGRYIRSKLATGNINGINYKAGSAVSADISLYYKDLPGNKGWSGGITLSNLGSRISYVEGDGQADFLPASFSAGAAYTEVLNDDHSVSLALDIDKLLVPAAPINPADMKSYRETTVIKSWLESFDNNAWQIGFGTEYSYKGLLSVRAGYSRKSHSAGNGQSITAGAGYKINSFQLNFSYLIPIGDRISRSPLSNTIRLGLLFDPGK